MLKPHKNSPDRPRKLREKPSEGLGAPGPPGRSHHCRTTTGPVALSLGLAPSQISQDYQTFLDKADIVDIVTPTDSHTPLCCEALNRGKDVSVEKPMTMNSEQAREVASLVQKTNRLLQVGVVFRVHPISQYVKKAVEEVRENAVRIKKHGFDTAGFFRDL